MSEQISCHQIRHQCSTKPAIFSKQARWGGDMERRASSHLMRQFVKSTGGGRADCHAMTDLELHRTTTHGRHRLRSTIVYGVLGTRYNILSNRRRLVVTQDSSRFPVVGQRRCCPGPGAKQSSHWPNHQPSSFWRRTGTPYVAGCGWKPKVTSPPQYVAFSEFLFRRLGRVPWFQQCATLGAVIACGSP